MPDPVSAIKPLVDMVRPGDLILIKGSQGMRMEIITEQLLVDPRIASELLCRQSSAWRQKSFTPPAEWTAS